MKIIDLTQPLFDSMPVYPGDPPVSVKLAHTLDKDGWNLRGITLNTHAGTHVNVPAHMVAGGKTLDDLALSQFMGKAVVYKQGMSFQRDTGIIFVGVNIDRAITDALIAHPPKFIGLSEAFDFDADLERELLEAGIISYENLANVDSLPPSFTFHGVPLPIQSGDGSPVRAYAIAANTAEDLRARIVSPDSDQVDLSEYA